MQTYGKHYKFAINKFMHQTLGKKKSLKINRI